MSCAFAIHLCVWCSSLCSSYMAIGFALGTLFLWNFYVRVWTAPS
jgi:hypothetical protein